MDKLEVNDILDYKFLSDLKFSPKLKYSFFVISEMDLESNKYKQSLHILKNRSQITEKLIELDNGSSVIWKNEATVLFTGKEGEDKEREESGEPFTKFYSLNVENKEKEFAFEVPLDVNDVKLIDENMLLLKAKFDPRFSNFIHLSKEERENFMEEFTNEEDFEILDEIPFWSNGEGFTNKTRDRLYIYNIEDGILTPVTDSFTNIISFELDKSKEKLLIVSNSYIDKKYTSTDLQLYNIATGRLLKISPFDNFKYTYANFLKNKIIFTGTDMEDFGINQNPHFYSCNLEGFNCKKVSPDSFDFNVTNSIGSDSRYGKYDILQVDGDFLYFVTTEGDSSFINRIDLDGNIKKLTHKKGSIDCINVKNDTLQFIGLRSLRLHEVYRLNGKKETQLTLFNEWVLEDRTLSIPEKLTFRTEDETLIEGWVMKPTDFKLGKKYPAILNIHGGPKTAFGEVFFHDMQYLANQGFVVFFCNPRGSDGRGNNFADIRGKYGDIDYEDIMDFTDLVLEKYHFIDSSRLGVTGGSYGGFMTNWIIGKTNRFKAAVSQRSISNWISKFATTDIGYYFVDDQITATPWNGFDKLWDSSPMKRADKVETPTLFIHSQEDYRCWTTEAYQMFTSLKYHGVQTRLCLFKGENHELSRSGKPKNRIKRLEEMKNWFEKYLK